MKIGQTFANFQSFGKVHEESDFVKIIDNGWAISFDTFDITKEASWSGPPEEFCFTFFRVSSTSAAWNVTSGRATSISRSWRSGRALSQAGVKTELKKLLSSVAISSSLVTRSPYG